MSKLFDTTITFLRDTYANMGDKDRFAALFTHTIETMPTFVRKEIFDELFGDDPKSFEKVELRLEKCEIRLAKLSSLDRNKAEAVLVKYCGMTASEALGTLQSVWGYGKSRFVYVDVREADVAVNELNPFFNVEIRFNTDIAVNEEGYETRTMRVHSARTVSDKR